MAESSARQGGPALESMYRFLLWLIPAVEKFPRSQKFQLGDRIQNAALDVLERLIEAPFRDRLVHPALCAVAKCVFERGFFANSFVIRIG